MSLGGSRGKGVRDRVQGGGSLVQRGGHSARPSAEQTAWRAALGTGRTTRAGRPTAWLAGWKGGGGDLTPAGQQGRRRRERVEARFDAQLGLVGLLVPVLHACLRPGRRRPGGRGVESWSRE